MTQHHTVDIAFPPPLPPPRDPGKWPPPPGPPPPSPGSSRRSWPALAAAAAAGAVVAAIIAALITMQVRDTTPGAAPTHAPVTKTVQPPAPASPAPLPTAQADHQTCYQGWDAASRYVDMAKDALRVLPKGMKVSDPAVQSNPDWIAALQKAGSLYQQASDTLRAQIAPGTTPVLAAAANTAVPALRTLGDATANPTAANGNAFGIADAAAKEVGALCNRLAP